MSWGDQISCGLLLFGGCEGSGKRGGGSNAPKGRKKIAPDEMFNMGKMSYRQHSQRQANMRHIYHTYI